MIIFLLQNIDQFNKSDWLKISFISRNGMKIFQAEMFCPICLGKISPQNKEKEAGRVPKWDLYAVKRHLIEKLQPHLFVLCGNISQWHFECHSILDCLHFSRKFFRYAICKFYSTLMKIQFRYRQIFAVHVYFPYKSILLLHCLTTYKPINEEKYLKKFSADTFLDPK